MSQCGVKVSRITGKAKVTLGDNKTVIVTGFCGDEKAVYFGRDEDNKFSYQDVSGETESTMKLKSSIVFTTDDSIDNLIEILTSLKTIKR